MTVMTVYILRSVDANNSHKVVNKPRILLSCQQNKPIYSIVLNADYSSVSAIKVNIVFTKSLKPF